MNRIMRVVAQLFQRLSKEASAAARWSLLAAVALIGSVGLAIWLAQAQQNPAPEVSAAANDGLVAWWKMDEGGGTELTDSGGNDYTAQLAGEVPPIWVSNATDGVGLQFQSVDGYVLAPAAGDLAAVGNALTVAVWVKPDAQSHGTLVETQVDTGEAGSTSLYLTQGHVVFEVMLDGTARSVLGGVELTGDVWHQVVGVYDGDQVLIYVDGALDRTRSAHGTMDTVSQSILLGRGASDWPLVGMMSDVRIYSRALNQSEIHNLYEQQTTSESSSDVSGPPSGSGSPSSTGGSPSGNQSGLSPGGVTTNWVPQFSLLSGCPQMIDSSSDTSLFIDDYTDHTYNNPQPPGSYADCTIQRTFARPIANIKVTVVSGTADDIGFVGGIQVTATGNCTNSGPVNSPTDVSSQVTVISNTATLLLRAKENCCCETGWGPDTSPGRPPARLHWEVTLGANNDPCGSGAAVIGGSGSASGDSASGTDSAAEAFYRGASEDGNQIDYTLDGLYTGRGGGVLRGGDLMPVRQPGDGHAATLAFGRTQTSDSKNNGPMGRGWTHNYNVLLTANSNQVTVTDWNGSERTFVLTNSNYVGEPGTQLYKVGTNFVWQLSHGTKYTFDGLNNNRLSSLTDRNSNSVSLAYAASGLMTQVTDGVARKLLFQYDATNRLSRVIDPISRTNTYAYTTNGLLITVTDALGVKARYEWLGGVNSNAVTRYTDANNLVHKYTYGSDGKIRSETNSAAAIQSYTHTPSASTIKETNWLNTAIYTIYNNNVGAITAIVDNAGTRSFGRDSQKRLTTYTDRLGKVTQFFHETNSCACSGGGKLTKLIDPLGRTNGWTYENTFNKPLTFTNGAIGVYVWGYDPKGNLTSQFDPGGGTTTFSRDGVGNLTKLISPGMRTNTFAYDGSGNRTNLVDGLGNLTSYGYDGVGRVLNQTDPLSRVDLYTWDARDRLVRSINGAGSTNRWVYDGNGNVVAWTNELGFARVYNYDNQNRLSYVHLPETFYFLHCIYDPAGNLLEIDDVFGNYTTVFRDSMGRMTGMADRLFNIWTYTLDAEGRRTKVIDPNVHTNSFGYDNVGQVTSWANGLGNSVEFNYDRLGNLGTISGPGNNSLKFTYDALSRLTNINYAGLANEKFRYDADGNTTGMVTRANQTISLTYDLASRLTQKSYVGVSDSFGFGYDKAGQMTGGVWSVGTATNALLSYRYDGAGRLTNEIQAVTGAAGRSVGYEFYADGRRKKLIYTDGTFVTYDYNSNGWLTAVKDGGATAIVSYSYDSGGRRTQRTLENSSFTIYDYDADDQVTNVLHRQTIGTTTNTISQYLYGYDSTGNRQWIKRADGKGDRYTYDAADQLTDAKYNATTPDGTPSGWDRQDTYQYDAAGNRSSVQIIRTYNLGLNYGNNVNVLNQYTNTVWPSETVSPTGAVFRLDDCSGSTTLDWITSQTATLDNGASWTNGVYRCAVAFDGNNDRINLGDRNDLEAWQSFTFATWIYPRQFITTRDTRLISKDKIYFFGFTSATTNRLSLKVGNSGSWQATTTGSALLPSNVWTHVAVTYTNGVVRFYVNGELTDTISQTYTMGNNGQNVFLSHGSEAFNGFMDDVRLYPPAFPAHEVRALTGMREFRYDGNGNLTNDHVWAYSYDYENRLRTASNGTVNISYTYDPLGRLVERKAVTPGGGAGSTTNRYYYAGWQLIEERNNVGGAVAKYVYGPGIDEPVRMTRSGTNYYFHVDGLGSVTEVTTNGGFKVESYRYDVYGTPLVLKSSGATNATSAIGNRLMFTGRDRDPDTSLYNYRYRYYSPSLGRFVQVDPIGTDAGLNLYSFSHNNSVNRTDPFGLLDPGTVGTVITTTAAAESATAGAAAGATGGAAAGGGLSVAGATGIGALVVGNIIVWSPPGQHALERFWGNVLGANSMRSDPFQSPSVTEVLASGRHETGQGDTEIEALANALLKDPDVRGDRCEALRKLRKQMLRDLDAKCAQDRDQLKSERPRLLDRLERVEKKWGCRRKGAQ